MKSASRKSTGAAPSAPSTPDSTLVVRTTCRVAGWFNLGTKWINCKWRQSLENPANGNYTAQTQAIHDFQGINIDKCCRELFGWPHYKIMLRSGNKYENIRATQNCDVYVTFIPCLGVQSKIPQGHLCQSRVYHIYHWNWNFILHLFWLVIPFCIPINYTNWNLVIQL